MNADKKTPRPIVRTSVGQTDYKRELAYERLGINPKDVQCIPFLAADLRRIACTVRGVSKHSPPTAPVRALDFLECSEDPEARKVLEVYLSVPESYRRLLRPEDFCHAAGVSPWRVLESITVVAVRQAGQASAVVASILHPRVVAKTIERALQDDGDKERHNLQQGHRIPAESGLTTLQSRSISRLSGSLRGTLLEFSLTSWPSPRPENFQGTDDVSMFGVNVVNVWTSRGPRPTKG